MAQILKKLSFVQEKVIKRFLDELVSTGNGKTNWYIIIDDNLVGKIGKIFSGVSSGLTIQNIDKFRL